MPGILCSPPTTTKEEEEEEQPALPEDFAMSHVIAYRPERPPMNPPREVSMDSALRGRAVRLEAPEELDGDWDGPVYAILDGDAKHLQPTDRSPFVMDDGQRVPAWPCKLVFLRRGQVEAVLSPERRRSVNEIFWIPFWRLTHPHRDLSRELEERPLLSVFRYARFSRMFVASPGDDTKLELRVSPVRLCGQVLAYRPAASVSLVDAIGVIQEPGSAFVCTVAIRRYTTERPLVVTIPLSQLQDCFISAEEFMLGYGQGLASAVTTMEFAVGWATLVTAAPRDPLSVRAQLTTCFTLADPTVRPFVDTGTAPVSYVTPQGVSTSAVPVDYVLRAIVPVETRDADEIDACADNLAPPVRAPLGGPLLQRADIVLTLLDDERIPASSSAEQPTTSVVHRPAPAQSTSQTAPPVVQQPPIAPPAGLSSTEQFLFTMLQQQRETADRQFAMMNQQMTQFAQAMSNIQQQFTNFQPLLSAQPPLQLAGSSEPTGAPGAPAVASTPPQPTAPAQPVRSQDAGHRRSREGATYDADRDDVGRSRTSRTRSRSPRRQRDRDRSRERSRSPLARRSLSPPRFGRHDRSRSRDRSPARRPSGTDRYNPSRNELQVNEYARVRPRSGTNHESELFAMSDVQDQVRTMLRDEQFRCRYNATKVTTKMLFTVNFATRPLDHFLSEDGPQLAVSPRLVMHDASQWSGQEPAPQLTIRRAEQLHRSLHAIQEAAARWYPRDLARVFRAVHGDAIHAVLPGAPQAFVNAMCNLYSAVFYALFNNILSGMDLDQLESRAIKMLRRDSSEYQRYVGDVLQTAMMHSVFRSPPMPSRPPGPSRPPARPSPGGRGRPADRGRRPPGKKPSVSPAETNFVVPEHIRKLIPMANEEQEYCLRHQTMKECDFDTCKHAHDLTKLPREVIEWLEARHGSLKSDHPGFL